MAIYEVEGGFVISSQKQWVPGFYNSRSAARYAFQFSNAELQQLQDKKKRGRWWRRRGNLL